MFSILIIEDHMGFANALQRLLARQPDLEVVGVIQSAEEALKILHERKVDLVLADVSLPPPLHEWYRHSSTNHEGVSGSPLFDVVRSHQPKVCKTLAGCGCVWIHLEGGCGWHPGGDPAGDGRWDLFKPGSTE